MREFGKFNGFESLDLSEDPRHYEKVPSTTIQQNIEDLELISDSLIPEDDFYSLDSIPLEELIMQEPEKEANDSLSLDSDDISSKIAEESIKEINNSSPNEFSLESVDIIGKDMNTQNAPTIDKDKVREIFNKKFLPKEISGHDSDKIIFYCESKKEIIDHYLGAKSKSNLTDL